MNPARYNAVAMALHWLIAALIVTNIGLAWYFGTLHGQEKVAVIQVHKPIGITVLILTLARLGWRFAKPPPPLPIYVSGWERVAAKTVYVLFYGVMIGLPLTGWAMVSASRLIHLYPINFGLFVWPAITPLTSLPPEQMRDTHEFFQEAHELIGWLAYGLIGLHVAAALRHQFILRDGVLARMVPFLKARTT
ncbi:MAG TPA: cytochrome b [Caulobacteraceae bacterium]|nr:cytochrome b [Caulobacteraceae bacterium]